LGEAFSNNTRGTTDILREWGENSIMMMVQAENADVNIYFLFTGHDLATIFVDAVVFLASIRIKMAEQERSPAENTQ
jgi:hypothetical protein